MKKTVGGIEFDVRGLTRREVRELREAGVDLQSLSEDVSEQDAQLQKCFDLAVTDPDATEDLTFAEAVQLFAAICELTFLGDAQAKKSKPSRRSGSKAALKAAGGAGKSSRGKGAAPK